MELKNDIEIVVGQAVSKGALDKCNIIPQFFPKKYGIFYTIWSIGMSNDCMLSFTFYM